MAGCWLSLAVKTAPTIVPPLNEIAKPPLPRSGSRVTVGLQDVLSACWRTEAVAADLGRLALPRYRHRLRDPEDSRVRDG